MAFSVEIKNPDITIEPECTQKVIFSVDIPECSQARTKDVGVCITVVGKILANAEEAGKPADSTSKLLEWSKVPVEKKEAYRSVTVKSKAGGVITRQYEFPNAFIVDYLENFDASEGSGVFTLKLKQVKNKLADVKITGGFAE